LMFGSRFGPISAEAGTVKALLKVLATPSTVALIAELVVGVPLVSLSEVLWPVTRTDDARAKSVLFIVPRRAITACSVCSTMRSRSPGSVVEEAVVVKAPAAKKVRYNRKATNRYLTPRRRHLYQQAAIEAGPRLVLILPLNTSRRSARQRQHSCPLPCNAVDEHRASSRLFRFVPVNATPQRWGQN
jgi:hypothetical protein